MLNKIICKILGHKYKVDILLSRTARKVKCGRCNCKWAMEDTTRSFLPWDGDFEQLYFGRNK